MAFNSFPNDRSKALPMLPIFFEWPSVVSYVASVLPLFVPHLFFCCCPGRDVFRDCG